MTIRTDMKHMVLHVSTDTVGSEYTVDLGYTESEWNSLSEDQQNEAISGMRGNVMDEWVTAEKE